MKEGEIPEDGPKLAAEARLHQHVEILAILERLVEFDDEIAVGLLHDVLLRHDVLLLPRFHDLPTPKNPSSHSHFSSGFYLFWGGGYLGNIWGIFGEYLGNIME